MKSKVNAWMLVGSCLLCFLLFESASADIPVYPPYIKISGFGQWYQPGNGNVFGVNHKGFVRRARLAAHGRLNSHFSYKVQYDFALGGNWRNVWVNYRGDVNALRVGQFKMPFNSAYNQSSMYAWFNELPLPVRAFNPGFKRGVSYHFLQPTWNVAASVFSLGTQSHRPIRDPYGTTQRLLYVPIHKKGQVVQLGVSNWFQSTNNDTHRVSFGSIPEASGYIPVRTVKTGIVNQVNQFDVLEAEGVFQYHRFASELGYLYNSTPRGNGPTLHFDGWYAQASVFLLPNTMKYDFVQGRLGRPLEMKSAYQLVVRFSQLNLNDHDVQGGKEFNATVGLDTYFLKHIKFGINYIYANVYQSSTTINGHDNIVLANLQLML